MTNTRHPIFARFYARASRAMEPQIAHHRRRLLDGLTGRVLEVGAGNGLNFAHYPARVTEVLAVEPDPYLRSLAQQAATSAAVPVRVVEGTADALPAADGSFDAAVASLVLCSVPNQPSALAELQRVLRPEGELRFLEHVLAEDSRLLARVQRIADVIWPLIGGGCHASRDTLSAISAAGFQITDLQRFRFPDSGPPIPTAPHILGIARRPAVPTSNPS